jgi:antitoxin component of RelBE/YafQ-DinJ toxin-antitoxin module
MEKRPRGRPEIPEEERKGVIVACRVDAEERAQFDQAAERAGLRLSDWLRDRLRAAARRELRKRS